MSSKPRLRYPRYRTQERTRYGIWPGGASGPTNSVPPSVSGTVANGQTVQLLLGTWAGAVSYERIVLRNGQPADYPTTQAYVVNGYVENDTLSLQVVATAADGSRTVRSSIPYVFGAVIPPSDSVSPILTGNVSASNITSNGATLSCPAASDDVGVTGYRFSTNNGSTWTTSVTNSLGVTGLSASTVYNLAAQARDAAGNWSASISGAMTTASAPVSTQPRVLYAPANPSGTASVFNAAWGAAVMLGGSANAGRTGTFDTTAQADTTLYPWVAVLLSSVGAGVRFFDGTGYGGYSGALNSGIKLDGDPADPIAIYVNYTAPDGSVYAMFRRNGKATAATVNNSIL